MCSSSFLGCASLFGTKHDMGSGKWRRPWILSLPSKEVQTIWEEDLIGGLEARDLNSQLQLPFDLPFGRPPILGKELDRGRERGLVLSDVFFL